MPEIDTACVFMTPDELVARYKGNISVKTLANWRTKGGGPDYVKIGGKIMYEIAAVSKWERFRTYGSTAVKAASGVLFMLVGLGMLAIS